MRKTSTNRQVYQLIIILIFVIILLVLDMSNFVTTFKTEDVTLSLSNINVENWTNFSVGIFGTLFAVFGTWYVTDKSATRQIEHEKKLRMDDVRKNEELRHLNNIANLKIYYYIRNSIEDVMSFSEQQNSEENILLLGANTTDISYIEWQREINIINQYFEFKGLDFRIRRPLRLIPLKNGTLSRGVDMYGKQTLIIDIEKLKKIKLPLFEYYPKFSSTRFDQIQSEDFDIITKVNTLYLGKPIDILKLTEDEFKEVIRNQVMAINKDFGEFRNNIKFLEVVLKSKSGDSKQFSNHYTKIKEYIIKLGKLYICEGNREFPYTFQGIPEDNIDFSKLQVFPASNSSEFLGKDLDLQIVVYIDEFKKIIENIEV